MAIAGLVPMTALSKELRTPTPVIVDSDMYSDIDDMLALAMLNALQDRGEIKLLAITIGTDAPFVAPYVDLVNTYYGHGNTPIGMTRGGITADYFKKKEFVDMGSPWAPNGVSYTQYLAQVKGSNGLPIFPHDVVDSSRAPEAVGLLRKVLADQPDGSVVMIQVGYATTFARLLASTGDRASTLDGKALVRKKVKLLATMAGSFRTVSLEGKSYPAGRPEFNIRSDIPAAQAVFTKWPTPVVVSGLEIGISLLFPRKSIDRHFSYSAHHPIADTYLYVDQAYVAVSGHPDRLHDHPTFDLTSVLYAARPDESYFDLSNPGKITVLDDGSSHFTEVEGGSHRYLVLSDDQKARALEAMVMLTSQPPVCANP